MPATTLRRLCPVSRLVEVAPQLRPELAIWRYVAQRVRWERRNGWSGIPVTTPAAWPKSILCVPREVDPRDRLEDTNR